MGLRFLLLCDAEKADTEKDRIPSAGSGKDIRSLLFSMRLEASGYPVRPQQPAWVLIPQRRTGSRGG